MPMCSAGSWLRLAVGSKSVPFYPWHRNHFFRLNLLSPDNCFRSFTLATAGAFLFLTERFSATTFGSVSTFVLIIIFLTGGG